MNPKIISDTPRRRGCGCGSVIALVWHVAGLRFTLGWRWREGRERLIDFWVCFPGDMREPFLSQVQQ